MESAFFAVFCLVAQPRQSTKRRTAKRVVRKKRKRDTPQNPNGKIHAPKERNYGINNKNNKTYN